MKDLYIVSTYYHALISCIKQLRSCRKTDILVTDYIPQHEYLAQKIQESRLFDQVILVGRIHEYTADNKLDYIFNYHRKNAKYIETQLSFSLRVYNEIYIFHDDTWFAHYLKCAGIQYNLIEDALDSFKIISRTPFGYMLRKNDLKLWIKNTFRIGYVFCGYDRFTKSVEINCIQGVEIRRLARKKLVECPRKPMFDSLTKSELEILEQIFLRDIPVFDDRNSALMITQPLFEDGIVSSESEQIEIFRKLAEKHCGGYTLVIKPHPRDNTDYHAVFPDSIIINKNMPLEVIFMVRQYHFKRAALLDITCARGIQADKICMEHIQN